MDPKDLSWASDDPSKFHGAGLRKKGTFLFTQAVWMDCCQLPLWTAEADMPVIETSAQGKFSSEADQCVLSSREKIVTADAGHRVFGQPHSFTVV